MRFLSLLICALLVTAAARADSGFDAAAAAAYGPYRVASNYLRTGNPGLASLELATAAHAWSGVQKTYGSAAPKAYAGDGDFAATLAKIGDALSAGLDLAGNGDKDAAAKAIAPVRGWIYDLRRRNGVRLYPDCITELNRAMEPLWVYRHEAPDLKDPDVRAQVKSESLAYAALVDECREMASDADKGNVEFKRLFTNAKASVMSMLPAVDSGDQGRIVNVLRELRSLDRIIYFRFGG